MWALSGDRRPFGVLVVPTQPWAALAWLGGAYVGHRAQQGCLDRISRVVRVCERVPFMHACEQYQTVGDHIEIACAMCVMASVPECSYAFYNSIAWCREQKPACPSEFQIYGTGL